jgi:hypothetical protein
MAKSPDGKRPAKKPKPGSSNVPGTYLGFSLQSSRFLMRLLRAEAGDVVCLEVFEDVGVERADGTKVAEQNKSNQTYNALSDRAQDFWKTMANWAKAVVAGELDASTTQFEIFTAKPAGGPIAVSFRDANSVEQAMAAIDAAQQALLGQPKKNGRPSLGEGVEPYVTAFFGCDRRIIANIVTRFTFKSGQGDSIEDLRSALMRKLVSDENCDDVLRWALGWIKSETDRLLERGAPARIHEEAFLCALRNYVRVHDRLAILSSVAGNVGVSSLKPEDDMLTYVKQLRLIEAEDEDVLAAVNDYLRAAADRTSWSVQGLIDEASLSKYCDELCRSWRNKKSRVSLTHADKPEIHQGKLLYLDCLDHTLPLDGCATHSHFARGSWHTLSEDQSVGWHPRYKEELQRVINQEDGHREVEG